MTDLILAFMAIFLWSIAGSLRDLRIMWRDDLRLRRMRIR